MRSPPSNVIFSQNSRHHTQENTPKNNRNDGKVSHACVSVVLDTIDRPFRHYSLLFRQQNQKKRTPFSIFIVLWQVVIGIEKANHLVHFAFASCCCWNVAWLTDHAHHETLPLVLTFWESISLHSPSLWSNDLFFFWIQINTHYHVCCSCYPQAYHGNGRRQTGRCRLVYCDFQFGNDSSRCRHSHSRHYLGAGKYVWWLGLSKLLPT